MLCFHRNSQALNLCKCYVLHYYDSSLLEFITEVIQLRKFI